MENTCIESQFKPYRKCLGFNEKLRTEVNQTAVERGNETVLGEANSRSVPKVLLSPQKRNIEVNGGY